MESGFFIWAAQDSFLHIFQIGTFLFYVALTDANLIVKVF